MNFYHYDSFSIFIWLKFFYLNKSKKIIDFNQKMFEIFVRKKAKSWRFKKLIFFKIGRNSYQIMRDL